VTFALRVFSQMNDRLRIVILRHFSFLIMRSWEEGQLAMAAFHPSACLLLPSLP
jgi:hypothetical protein